MTAYELTNKQRQYFGLVPTANNWDKHLLSDTITVYFYKEKIVKVLNYSYGYLEYDTDIDTRDRQILLPKSAKGRELKLTIPRILKIKGCGVKFSGSFEGGGIYVYDNQRNLCFIKGFKEEDEIKNYHDIDKWISNYIAKLPSDYFNWLNKQLAQKRLKVKVKEGDIVAFKIAQGLYGFAIILLDVLTARNKGDKLSSKLYGFYPRSLIVAPYAYYTDTLKIEIDSLVSKNTLPTICIFDLEVYRGEMPIVGYKALSEKDKQIGFPKEKGTLITIPYSKTDIDAFNARS